MLATQNVTTGPMFRVMGKEAGAFKRATTADLNPNLIDLLERVRKRWSNVFGQADSEHQERVQHRTIATERSYGGSAERRYFKGGNRSK